jgi:hypothetical protein
MLPYQLGHGGRIAHDVRLPEAEDEPATGSKGCCLLAVALPIACDFCYPVFGIVTPQEFRTKLRPVPPMPEVTIAEDRDSRCHENDIWVARQTHGVLAIPQAERPERPTQHQLRLRVVLSVGTFGA